MWDGNIKHQQIYIFQEEVKVLTKDVLLPLPCRLCHAYGGIVNHYAHWCGMCGAGIIF